MRGKAREGRGARGSGVSTAEGEGEGKGRGKKERGGKGRQEEERRGEGKGRRRGGRVMEGMREGMGCCGKRAQAQRGLTGIPRLEYDGRQDEVVHHIVHCRRGRQAQALPGRGERAEGDVREIRAGANGDGEGGGGE